MPDEDRALPDFPGYTGAFGRLMHLWGMTSVEGQARVRATQAELDEVMKVDDRELVVLQALHIRDVAIEAEVARRNIAATLTSVEATKELRGSIDVLHTTTQAAGAATIAAIAQLEASIQDLRISTETWSRWLTRLTIGIFGLTAIVAVAAVAPAWR